MADIGFFSQKAIFNLLSELSETKSLLSNIINSMNEFYLLLDRENNIQATNPYTLGLLGYKKYELINYSYDLIFDRENRKKIRESIDSLLEEKKPGIDFEVIVRRKEGKQIPLLLSASKVWDKYTQTESIILVGKDISERKQAEKALQKACDELEVRVEKRTARLVKAKEQLEQEITEHKQAEARLKQTMADLERSNVELEQFAYITSHDLQEPLRMVASYVQLLARRYKGKLDADADDFIAYAVDGATRMQQMINDLLAYSRVGTRGSGSEPADCEAILDRVLAHLRVAIEESGAVVTHDPLPTVMADVSQLTQLFQNLIGNAIKFHDEEPLRVHISAEQKGNEWVFSVCDNGIGIDPEYANRIFVIFERLHGKEYPGTGIGLAICKRIIERHRGRIWMESEPGKGSTFYFTIPRSET